MRLKYRVSNVNETPHISEKDKRKTVDYTYDIFPHAELIKDMKRFHAKSSLMKARASRNDVFDQPSDIESK
jgi:hypothetical protein